MINAFLAAATGGKQGCEISLTNRTMTSGYPTGGGSINNGLGASLTGMNEKLKAAEEALKELLSQHREGLTMDRIIAALGSEFGEAELRAAVWTLKARGVVDFADGRLQQHAVAA